ncbi:PEP-CTERM sorting domain-containing protein [Luteitalea pratensis]|nr:PEP-CTERM sorting domain-containing protein [Luteitalea pratensis]
MPAQAAVIAVGPGAFGPGATLTTFNGLADGLEVDGLVVNGILFDYSLGAGSVVINGGPGVTNNIAPQNIVSIGANAGVLTLTLPGPVSTFGYGFALLNTIPVPAATTIRLFSGATDVGSLSYAGAPDPVFTGGFAGIQSTLLFNRVELTFNAVAAPAFALDNIRTSTAANVPEPGTMLLLTASLAVLGARVFRRSCS